MAASRIWGFSSSAQPSLSNRLGWAFRTLWRAYLRWYERRAAMYSLTQLDDRMLKDIGITRAEIETMVRNGGAARRGRRI